MEQLPNGYTLDLPNGTFPLSTDSMVLSHFIKPPRSGRILDLGSGCGTLGLLLCAAHPDCRVTGIEVDPAAQEAALDNIRRNGLGGRMESICADLRTVPNFVPPGSYSCCISNPPYFSGGPASSRTPAARRDDLCTIQDLCRAAAWSLKFGGDFYIVHKPERMAEIIAAAAAFSLEAKQLQLVRHAEGGAVTLILLHLRKGAKPGLRWDELSLHHPDGTPTDAYREIYHI